MTDELPVDPEQLVLGVQRDPAAALRQAAVVLERAGSARDEALARWTIGMAHRERGDLHLARSEFEAAWERAIELDDDELAGRVAITLSLVVAYQGALPDALAILDLTEPALSDDSVRGRLRTQRGVILYQQGEFGLALAEYDAALKLLDRPDRPTGVLCFSDAFALATIRAAEHLGLRVPDDLSVVGFDDSALAAASRPPLTTVNQEVAAKGRAAVASIVEVMAGGSPEPVVLPTRLTVRGSTAAPH